MKCLTNYTKGGCIPYEKSFTQEAVVKLINLVERYISSRLTFAAPTQGAARTDAVQRLRQAMNSGEILC